MVFTAAAIIGGMIWGKATWNVYWTWDARLTLTAIMLFVYVGYLALRRIITEPEARARRSAILGIVGLVQLIPVHFSVTIVYAALLRHRIRLEDLGLEAYTEAIAATGPVAGDAVSAPKVGNPGTHP